MQPEENKSLAYPFILYYQPDQKNHPLKSYQRGIQTKPHVFNHCNSLKLKEFFRFPKKKEPSIF